MPWPCSNANELSPAPHTVCSSLPWQECRGTSSSSSCYFILTVAGGTSYVGLHSEPRFKRGREWRGALQYCVWVLLIYCRVQMLLQLCWRYTEKAVLRATSTGLCFHLELDLCCSYRSQQKTVSLSHERVIHYCGCYSDILEVGIHSLLQYRTSVPLSARYSKAN